MARSRPCPAPAPPAVAHLGEVAELLALGLLRARARRLGLASGNDGGDPEQVRLDFGPGRSVSPDRLEPPRNAP